MRLGALAGSLLVILASPSASAAAALPGLPEVADPSAQYCDGNRSMTQCLGSVSSGVPVVGPALATAFRILDGVAGQVCGTVFVTPHPCAVLDGLFFSYVHEPMDRVLEQVFGLADCGGVASCLPEVCVPAVRVCV